MTIPSLFWKAAATLRRGVAHEKRLDAAERTVVVSGTRGKSAATRWLYEILYSRGDDVFAKITGNRPLVLYDGETHDIDRGRRVTLYENEEQLRKFSPSGTIVLENQAIGEYTTRLVHERFGNPEVIFLTNVRRDHLDRLGRDSVEIARAFARTIPDDSTVVLGEQDEGIRELIESKLRDDVTVRRVSVPEPAAEVPAAETIYGLNEVLEAIGEEPLSERRLAAYLDEMRVEWTQLSEGEVYNAASVNDVDSTEIIRQALDGPEIERIQPLVYVRADRRARTVSFIEYLESLYEREVFELSRVVGPHADLVSRQASFPVATHAGSEPPEQVLDAALAPGWPVFIVGNTVTDFMRNLAEEIETRKQSDPTQPPRRSTVPDGNQTEDNY